MVMRRAFNCCLVCPLKVAAFLICYYSILTALGYIILMVCDFLKPWRFYPDFYSGSCIFWLGQRWIYRIVLILVIIAKIAAGALVIIGAMKLIAMLLFVSFILFTVQAAVFVIGNIILVAAGGVCDSIAKAGVETILVIVGILEGFMSYILWSNFVYSVEAEMGSSSD